MEEGDESLEERLARFEVLLEQQRVDAAANVDARINQALEEQRLIVEGLRSVHFQGNQRLSALEVGLKRRCHAGRGRQRRSWPSRWSTRAAEFVRIN